MKRKVKYPQGGDLVLGAEQEPECADWMGSCGGSSWGFWTMGANTMPRAFDIVQEGDEWVYTPSPLLEGEPELVTEPEQVTTYTISEDAVWSDETPISCADFVYTWDQVANGEEIYDRTGFRNIGSVECPDGDDGKTVVVTYATPFAGWKSIFGGQFGIFPAHILEGQDRNAAMVDGYDWSGGPWIIDEWTRGEQIVLVPNENYWGTVPSLDKRDVPVHHRLVRRVRGVHRRRGPRHLPAAAARHGRRGRGGHRRCDRRRAGPVAQPRGPLAQQRGAAVRLAGRASGVRLLARP